MWQQSLKQIFELGFLCVILPDKNYIDKVEYINKLEYMIIDKLIKVSQSSFVKPHFYVEMVRCNIVLNGRSAILPLRSILLPRLKSIFYNFIYLQVPLEVGSGVAAARLYLTKEYLAVASETLM